MRKWEPEKKCFDGSKLSGPEEKVDYYNKKVENHDELNFEVVLNLALGA